MLLKIAILILLGLVLFVGCGQQHPELPEGKISEYLPITLNDQFELTSLWHYYNYPYAKTDFTPSELMIIYRAISSFSFYGYSHPWQNAGIFGLPPFLNATSEEHSSVISFIDHSQWGTIARAEIDNTSVLWFTIDPDAYWEVIRLLRGPR